MRYTKSFLIRNPAHFADYSHFPDSFDCLDDALASYNMLGVQLKIQFRKYVIRRTEDGFTTMFTLCCHLRQQGLSKLNKQQLKIKERFQCPVQVKFKWAQHKMQYIRSQKFVMQHTHDLKVKDRCTIINDPAIHEDIVLWLKCGFSVAQITSTLQIKYKQIAGQIIYQDVYNLAKQFSPEKIKTTYSEFQKLQQFIQQQRDASANIAWQYDGTHIVSIYMQSEQQKHSYSTFGQVMFVDLSTRKSNSDSEYYICVLSGINGAGGNTVFAVAILNTLEAVKWALWEFKCSLQHMKEPETIMTDYRQTIVADAVSKCFDSTLLFCQNSVKKYLRDVFQQLQVTKRQTKNLLDLIVDIVQEPSPVAFQSILEIICAPDNSASYSVEQVNALQRLVQLKQHWSTAWRFPTLTFGAVNLNRALSISKILNSKLLRTASMIDLMTVIDQHRDSKVQVSLQDEKMVVHHPILHQIQQMATTFALQLCLRQYAFSHTVEATDKCYCDFRVQYDLPCAHLFAWWNWKQIRALPDKLQNRWLLEYQ